MPDAAPEPAFSDFGLAEALIRSLDEVGYETPTPIQAQTIPVLLGGRDLIGQAQTGTGKTAAFALPILSRIELHRREPQVLVLAPTRELAIQVAEAFQRYARYLPGFHVAPIYGGQSYGLQLKQLERGVHVVVGTPGRVMDHMRRGSLRLHGIATIVLDEADEMLRMGFIDDVEWILEQAPEPRQVALFSATMPAAVRRVAQRHLRDPQQITIGVHSTAAATIRQRYWIVDKLQKIDALTRVLEVEDFDGVLVFVRTKVATAELAQRLEARGYATAPLSGDIPQPLRERTVERFKAGQVDILIATDVAARGLDVKRISHVINYDTPYDIESYVHRIGRTGRAGRAGEAILLVAPRERRMLRSIEQATRQRIEPMQVPTAQMVNDARVTRFKQRITDALAGGDLDIYRRMIDEYRQEHETPPEDIAAALAKLAQGDTPLLLSAEETADREPPPRPRGRTRAAAANGLARYCIMVGHRHGAKPGQIVGAIANEAGLQGSDIGRISISDDFSVVELPADLPSDLLRILSRTRVAGQALRIAPADGADGSGRSQPRAPRKKRF